MFIGAMQFEILIHDATSLKDKRSVVRSVKDRLHREHQVSVAEVGAHDALGRAVLGLSVVARDPARCNEVLDACTAKLRALTDGELGVCRRRVAGAQLVDEEGDAPEIETVTDLEARMLRELAQQEDDA
ncbi:MAG: hypothetical protein Tsb0013_02440 [Phycisphaerales bacterium]